VTANTKLFQYRLDLQLKLNSRSLVLVPSGDSLRGQTDQQQAGENNMWE
jgi:hypothetical protein